MRRIRSLVLVPATLDPAFEVGLCSALASEVDATCIDVEGMPTVNRCETCARAIEVATTLAAWQSARAIVRVNSVLSMRGVTEVLSVLDSVPSIAAIVMPKVYDADEVSWLGSLLDDAKLDVALLPIIETAAGLRQVGNIASAHRRVGALLFGGNDMSEALGCEMAWEPLLEARTAVVRAALAAGIQSIDSPHRPGVHTLLEDAERSRALGMTGKSVRSVSEIATIHQVFV